MSTMTAYHKDC